MGAILLEGDEESKAATYYDLQKELKAGLVRGL